MLTTGQINDLHRLYWSDHWPIRKIERHLHMGWETIKKYLDMPAQTPAGRPRSSKLDLYKATIARVGRYAALRSGASRPGCQLRYSRRAGAGCAAPVRPVGQPLPPGLMWGRMASCGGMPSRLPVGQPASRPRKPVCGLQPCGAPLKTPGRSRPQVGTPPTVPGRSHAA